MVTNIDPASSMKLLSSFKALLQHNGRALLLLLLLSFIFHVHLMYMHMM